MSCSIKFLFIFSLVGYVVGDCFTMPPKVIQIPNFKYSFPDVNSPTYEHDTHECPYGYYRFNAYSNTNSYCLWSDCGKVIWSVVSYAVCCSSK